MLNLHTKIKYFRIWQQILHKDKKEKKAGKQLGRAYYSSRFATGIHTLAVYFCPCQNFVQP